MADRSELLEQLASALDLAYPSHGDLAMLVTYVLSLNLYDLVRPAKLPEMLHDLLEWTEREDRTLEFARKVLERRPTDTNLQRAVQALEEVDAAGDHHSRAFGRPDPTGIAQAKRESLVLLPAPPPPVPDFTGRILEIEKLIRHLTSEKPQAAVACIFGKGGIGKTQLALAVASRLLERYRDQFLIDLQPGNTPLAPEAILGQLILAVQPSTRLATDRLLLETQFRKALDGRQGLILADNALDVSQAQPLGLAPPGWAILVTSRARFSLPGALLHDLDLLPANDSVAFLSTAFLSGGRGDLAAADLGLLAKSCGQLPLALRVAVGFLSTYRDWTLDDYLSALRTARLEQLRGISGQASVAYVLGLSVEELRRQDAHLAGRWQELAVFAGSFDHDAAAAIWAIDGTEARSALSSLVQVSLVDYDAASERYSLHALLRDVAHLQPLAEEVQDRHVAYYLALAQQCIQAVPRDNHRLELEFTQMAAAMDRCLTTKDDTARRLLNALADFMRLHDRPSQLQAWSIAVLRIAESHNSARGRADALDILGDLELGLGHLAAARVHYEAALPLCEAVQDRLRRANILKSMGDLELRAENAGAARAHYETALPLYEEEHSQLGHANALAGLGDLESWLGNLDAARRHYETALPLYEAQQDRLDRANILVRLGHLERRQGNLTAARGHYNTAVPLYEEEQAGLGRALALESLGDLELQAENMAGAREHYDAALLVYEAEKARPQQANTRQRLGDLELQLRNLAAARGHFETALQLYEAEQASLGRADTLYALGELERHLGNRSAAQRYYTEALSAYRSVPDPAGGYDVLVRMAELASATGDTLSARAYYAEAFYAADSAGLASHPAVLNAMRSYSALSVKQAGMDTSREGTDLTT